MTTTFNPSNTSGVVSYYESNSHAQVGAYFSDETYFEECSEILERVAKEARMITTESVYEKGDEPIPADLISGLDIDVVSISDETGIETLVAKFDEMPVTVACYKKLSRIIPNGTLQIKQL